MNQTIQLYQNKDLKLRDYQANDLAKITTQLIGLSSLMGLRELTAMEAVAISDFIAEEFKDFTFQEVQHAFKMNAANKLLDSKGEKAKPYGSLNIDYVGTVLGLYREHRTKELRRINKAAPIPEKSQEQKDIELKQLMNEVFDEMNEHYKNGVLSFSFNNGIKYYGCLKYFNMLPDYKKRQIEVAKELWGKAKEMTLNSYMGSLDSNSRKIIAHLNDSKTPLSNDLLEKVRISTENNYKGLLVNKCLTDFSEFYDDLNECKN